VISYLLFFLAGVGFGYAAPGKWKWLPLLFPLALGIGAIVIHGVDASILLRLLIALVITVLGVLVGTMIDARAGRRADNARYA
jgi:ABC-type microcin C transport system permease subunit YejE